MGFPQMQLDSITLQPQDPSSKWRSAHRETVQISVVHSVEQLPQAQEHSSRPEAAAFFELRVQIPAYMARPFGWLPCDVDCNSIKEVFMGPKACASQGIPEYIELPVSIVTSFQVKDQLAFLKRLVQASSRHMTAHGEGAEAA
jgi:hypothetical protein